MEEKTPKENIVDFFKNIDWSDIIVSDEKISCPAGDIVMFDKDVIFVDFYFFNRTQNTYEKKNRPTLILTKGVQPYTILNSRSSSYDIQWFDYIKDILSIDDSYTKIKITENGKNILRKEKEKLIQIPQEIFGNLSDDSYDVYKKGKSSKNRLETYLKNKLKKKYTNKSPKETTTVAKGDFSFMVERFNLKNKKSSKDYEKFLTTEDTQNLEHLTEKLIRDEVFSSDFLHSLDEYFIKEKLKDIIAIGREILELGTTDLTTAKALKVISKITDDATEIKQLEGLWQKFFEKYLLYLVFSYKKIYPKIEFTNMDGDKKYPDFIGINHYNGLDIIEIKTHLKNAVTWDASHKNFSFSSELSKAIIQTMNYMDAIVQKRFKDNSDEQKVINMTEEENLFHPRGIIIISSDKKLTKSKLNKAKNNLLRRDFTKLRNSLNNIEILTFSEILQIADDYVKNIHSQYE